MIGEDTIYGGQDVDVINGGADNDLIYGNLDEDFIDGDAGHDTLYGGQENDFVRRRHRKRCCLRQLWQRLHSLRW